jgi:glycosyltransferase involved in cell wall biosynthesis
VSIGISIITATWNAAATIPDCLATIQAQRSSVDFIVIDNQSTDGTLDIVRRMCPECRVLSEPDRGIYDAMNKGINLASSDIVGILNADDFYAHKGVLQKIARVFENPTVDACYGDLLYVKELDGGRKAQNAGFFRDQGSRFKIHRYWKAGAFDPKKFYFGWMPPHPTFFVRRSAYEKFGLFNLDLGSSADYELMLRFLLKNGLKTAYIPEIVVKMRVGGVSNASLSNRLRANRMDRKAWDVNGLRPYPWTLFMKPLRKIPQWFYGLLM